MATGISANKLELLQIADAVAREKGIEPAVVLAAMADAIQKAASKHGSNLDGSKSDLEEFLALENVKKQENELRSMMQLYGRAGMYDDYIRFCGEARRRRKAAAEKAKREHEELLNFWIQAGFVAAVLAIGVYALWLIALILMEANAQ